MRTRTRFGKFFSDHSCMNIDCQKRIKIGIIHLVANKYIEWFCDRKCMVKGKALHDDYLDSNIFPINGEASQNNERDG